MTSNSENPPRRRSFALRGCLIAALLVALPMGAIAVYMGASAWLVPQGSPLARMYRTEADLTALATVIRMYHEAHGVYPPGGPLGFQMAIQDLSKSTQYFPGGAPPDAWGYPYQYIPLNEYERAGSTALRASTGSFFAPDTFQLYSTGMDGQTGVDDPQARRDNVTNWEESKPWRDVYRERQRTYATSGKE